ncbi:hypothetical protein [Robbsia sp. KACC 23696]|uniref:hypothetical protein n=1 Tax=Robbsia sp. KACC 23696 TaxID=3149231 RepID=UPI00325A60F1
MPPPLKIASRLIQILGTTLPGTAQRTARAKPPAAKKTQEVSGTLAALKNSTSARPSRALNAMPTARREVGGSALRRTQSMPTMRSDASASTPHGARGPQQTAALQQSPQAPHVPRKPLQSNSDLQQALTAIPRADFKPPIDTADEAAQLQTALANSRADSFLEPSTHGEEDAQLRKALLHSRADAFMPAQRSDDPHEAQLQQALALSRAEAFNPPMSAKDEDAQLQQALAHSRADVFMPPSAGHDAEDAALQQALALSRADAFMPPSSLDEEAAQLQQALAHSRADAFMPPSSHEEEAAQLQQALKQSIAQAPTPEHQPPAAEEPSPTKAMNAHESIAASTLMQTKLQAAIEVNKARTMVSKATVDLTRN